MSLMLRSLGLSQRRGCLCSRKRSPSIFQLSIEIMMLEPGENLILFNEAAGVDAHVFEPARDLWTDRSLSVCYYVACRRKNFSSGVAGFDRGVCDFDFLNTNRGSPITVSNCGGGQDEHQNGAANYGAPPGSAF